MHNLIGYFQNCFLPSPCMEGGPFSQALLFSYYLLMVLSHSRHSGRQFLGMCSKSQQERTVFPQGPCPHVAVVTTERHESKRLETPSRITQRLNLKAGVKTSPTEIKGMFCAVPIARAVQLPCAGRAGVKIPGVKDRRVRPTLPLLAVSSVTCGAVMLKRGQEQAGCSAE